MRKTLLVLALSLSAVCRVEAQENNLQPVAQFKIVVAGTESDYITGGNAYVFSNENGVLKGEASSTVISLRYDSTDGNEWWSFDFEAKTGEILEADHTYENAVRYPFNDDVSVDDSGKSKVNGIDVSSTGRGCNTITGKFKIREIQIDPKTNELQRLSLTFNQHCEGGQEEAVGAISLDNSKTPKLIKTPALKVP